LVIVIAAVCLVAAFSSSAKPENSGAKIGLINIQKIVMESKAGKEARSAFEIELGGKRSILQVREQEVKKLEDELKGQTAKLAPEARREKEEKFAKEVKELQRLKQDLEDDLKRKDRELSSKMLKDIFEVTQKVGQEKQFTIIMQSGPQIIYRDKAIDITDEVLKRYDSQYQKR
jgi:outer membrane protein